MPQIWATYKEIGDHLGCSAEEARQFAIDSGHDRRHSRDGLTRVKLSEQLAKAVLSRWLLADHERDMDVLRGEIASLQAQLLRATASRMAVVATGTATPFEQRRTGS